MKKLDLLKNLQLLHEQFKELIMDAGIDEKKYYCLLKNAGEKDYNTINNIYKAFKKLTENECVHQRKIYAIQSKEMWDNYPAYDLTHSAEYVALETARKATKVQFNTIYSTITRKRVKHVKKKSPTDEAVSEIIK